MIHMCCGWRVRSIAKINVHTKPSASAQIDSTCSQNGIIPQPSVRIERNEERGRAGRVPAATAGVDRAKSPFFTAILAMPLTSDALAGP
jgi:hypothetical protein